MMMVMVSAVFYNSGSSIIRNLHKCLLIESFSWMLSMHLLEARMANNRIDRAVGLSVLRYLITTWFLPSWCQLCLSFPADWENVVSVSDW